MPSAEEVAMMLSYQFLKDGRYSASTGPIEVPWLVTAAAADSGGVPFSVPEAFAGLAVQSVGFEEGVAEGPKVHIYLAKGSTKQIKALPDEIDGVPVAAHKMGPITIRPDAAGASANQGKFYERNNRVCCGSSCSPASENCAGTLGAIVRVHGQSGLFLLSNNHVFAGCNHVPKNQPILAPSHIDASPNLNAPKQIGRHHLIHELRSGNPMFVNPCDADLALARVPDDSVISSWQGGPSGYDTPTNVLPPVSMMKVKKIGRTTAQTTGVVESRVNTPMPVTYNSKYFKGTVWFKDVWTVRGDPGYFALSGDSGSLVVTEDASSSVGLVFAANANGEYAWIVPMPCITASFGGVQLVSNHGV